MSKRRKNTNAPTDGYDALGIKELRQLAKSTGKASGRPLWAAKRSQLLALMRGEIDELPCAVKIIHEDEQPKPKRPTNPIAGRKSPRQRKPKKRESAGRQLHEQYRPTDWDQFVGHARHVHRIGTLRKRGLGQRAFWISGPSGSGKTTMAHLIAHDIASDFFIHEIDAGALTTASLNDMEISMSLCATGKGGRAFIINEAHGLRRDVIRQLLTLLEERLPKHCVVVFTTTLAGESLLFDDCIDADPLLSRCAVFQLDTDDDLDMQFGKRAMMIAKAEGLDGGRDLRAFVELAQRTKCNMRAMLQAIDSGDMTLDEEQEAAA